MGYSTDSRGIRNFWPDDTDTEFYIAESATLEEIMTRCREKWGDECLAAGNIRVTPEFTHTYCIGYDLMDWGDYTHFLRITKGD